MTTTIRQFKAETDLISASLSADGKKSTLLLSCAQAKRKSQALSIANNIIDFAFADNISGYLVEQGNTTTFDQKQTNFSVTLGTAKVIEVSITAEVHDLRNASAWLFCFFCNQAGEILTKQRIEFDDGSAREIIAVPPHAKKMCFAVRIDGSGTIGNLCLSVAQSKQKEKALAAVDTDARMTTVIKKGSENAAKISDLVVKRDFEKGIAFYQSIEIPNDNDRKQLIRCYASQHQFEKVIAEFEKLSPQAQSNPGTRLYYMRALGNLGLVDKAEAFITSSCLNLKTDAGTLEFLITVYPFAVYISDRLAKLVLAKLLAYDGVWPKKSLNYLLRCAHDLFSDHRYEDFFKITHKLNALELNSLERTKIHVLESHAAHVLESYDLQMAHLNTVFTVSNAFPIAMPQPGMCLTLDKVFCPDNAPKSVQGPLVTILMTSFNSAKTIEYALRSLMNQTYANLEIIVIDDCSKDNSSKVVRSLCKEDQRITLIDLKKNGGTYVAKNTGLKQAKGVFVTCQDSDDWAHPQKIERCVNALMADEGAIATAVQHIRYDPKRGFRGLGGYIRPDASSLMYRRERVLETIGFYDSVRVGGDSEFQFRLERTFGRSAIKQLNDMLSLVLWSETSLSGGGKFAIDDDAGIFTPFRNAYRTAFCHWQEHTDSLRVPFPLEKRHFDVSKEGLP